MVKLAKATSFNANYYRDRQINAVIVGGTAGIGQGIAFKIAEYSRDPVITVCGRNETPGQETINKLKNINDKGTYHFERCDMSLLKETRDLAKRITAKYDKINLLVITSGYISLESYTETEDGMDARFTMFCAGRYALTYYLVPLLQASANKGEIAAALSVMTAGQGNKFLIDDIGLQENHKFSTARSHRAVLNDVMAEVTNFRVSEVLHCASLFIHITIKAFSKHYPEVSFHHSNPGIVNTNMQRNLPWYIRYPYGALAPFGISIENCGDYSLYAIASHLQEQTGFWSLINKDGEQIESTKAHTNDACVKSWDWFMDLLKKKGLIELS
ncbi:hypothetical protein NQZ79_g8870 [Umbelopsis isabellina]|nr:hypothetical protein NQZ79_g8870 [Umbelopsis isabellina]